MNNKVDDAAALEILKVLIERHPEAIRHAENGGELPIHLAAKTLTPEFCRVLIEAYPRSVRMRDATDAMPLHYACYLNTVATVEYLSRLYPDAINHATTRGFYPIHFTMIGFRRRKNPIDAVDIVKFLLDYDPNAAQQKIYGESLLHLACRLEYNDSIIHATREVIKAIYDTHPEATEDDELASDIYDYHIHVQAFINTQLVYARLAKDRHVMTTPDGRGQLPLHTALQNNATLGSIKLLVKGNPSAVRIFDNSGKIALHMACQYHDSTSVVQFMLSRDETILDTVDKTGNTAFHYACSGARYDTIALLLEKYDAVSVSKRNAHGKLPIDLLFDSMMVEDRESNVYIESVFRLLTAYPETLMNIGMQKQHSASACSIQRGNKQKFANSEE
ncbi:ankyrin repeat domain-containing protein [Skeletonema marinoi]|uniref:Ankyrin repeat domain-containing protein n=1 Tax=Skeletonema marinoi TaxID=267567 RepID=A0AAD9D4V0_9STRA|nr:ankyrin repeat domain-containing protein [Skeletonema marinoi]